MVRHTALGLVLVTALFGCGGESQSSSPPSSTGEQPTLTPEGQECYDEWNAASNAANQGLVAGTYAVAWVSLWDAEAEGSSDGEAEDGHKFDGCSYLFHDDETHLSFNGTWEGDRLRWDDEPFRGPWSKEQEEAVEDDAVVAEDGTLTFSPED
jgi:hypothetical protein